MPYALFEDDQKLSADYSSESEVWQQAEEAGLTDVIDGRKVLEDGYSIQPCVADDATGQTITVPRVVT